MTVSPTQLRLRYFGTSDYATYFQVEQAWQVLSDFDASRLDYGVNDVIELSEAQKYAERDLFPASSSEPERDARRGLNVDINRVVGTFFQTLTETTVAPAITGLDHLYHLQLLELFARHGLSSAVAPQWSWKRYSQLTSAPVSC